MPTTDYASWYNVVGSDDPEGDCYNWAGVYVDDYDMDAVIADYRKAIAEVLPGSMTLVGGTFVALASDPSIPEDWASQVAEAIQDIDLAPFFDDHPFVPLTAEDED